MSKLYQHTQIGYMLITVYVFFILFIVSLTVFGIFNLILFVALVIFVLCLPIFSKLTVSIYDDALVIRFGFGIIHKIFPINDIESCRVVKNHWYYGWGVRLTPHGWFYGVSGLDAVEIKMKTGKKYRIGTDVPNDLEKAISQTIGAKKLD